LLECLVVKVPFENRWSEISELPDKYYVDAKFYDIKTEEFVAKQVQMFYLKTAEQPKGNKKPVPSDTVRLRKPHVLVKENDKTIGRKLDVGLLPAPTTDTLDLAVKAHEIEVSTICKFQIDGDFHEIDLLQTPEFFFPTLRS
jgi:hypothetical protein